MSLSCCSQRTRHASAVRLLFLLLFVTRFQLQNRPLQNIYGGHDDLSSMLRLPFSHMPPLIQRSIRRCRLLLVALSHPFPVLLVRFGRSGCPCPFSSFLLHRHSPRVPVVVLLPVFVCVVRSSLPGPLLYSLSMHTMFHYFTLL